MQGQFISLKIREIFFFTSFIKVIEGGAEESNQLV